jgi:hypothetical protein
LGRTFISSSKLSATITPFFPEGKNMDFIVSVFTPPPGGGSAGRNFHCIRKPIISMLDPWSANKNTPGVTVHISGFDFTPDEVTLWDGSPLTSVFLDGSNVTASVPDGMLQNAGIHQIQLRVAVEVNNTTDAPFKVFAPEPAPGRIIEKVSVSTPVSMKGGSNGVVSSQGRWIAYTTQDASDVGSNDIFVRDRCSPGPPDCIPTTISATSFAPGNRFPVAISADGRYVLLTSLDDGLPAGDLNGINQVFLADTCIGANSCRSSIIRVSLATDGSLGNGRSQASAMTPDARYIAFTSEATNLVAGVSDGTQQLFLRDTCIGASPPCTPGTSLISIPDPATFLETYDAKISDDGRYVAFTGAVRMRDEFDPFVDVWFRDTCLGAPPSCVAVTRKLTTSPTGMDADSFSDFFLGGMSADARYVAFNSNATNLAPVHEDTIHAFITDTCIGATVPCTASVQTIPVEEIGGPGAIARLVNSMSSDGRFVSVGSPNAIRDTCARFSDCVPRTILLTSSDGAISQDGFTGSLSADGRIYVANSVAPDLIGGDANDADVFVGLGFPP